MSAREIILARLRQSLVGAHPVEDDYDHALLTAPWTYAPHTRIARLREMLEAVHGETFMTTTEAWPAQVLEVLRDRQIGSLLIAPDTEHGRQLSAHVLQCGSDLRLQAYDREVEQWKDELFFQTPASLTGALGGIAATGSLILWPGPQEPRLMSLVPPLHVALLKASTVYDNLTEAIERQSWAANLPTNALLISGPSKTADIQQTLAYGAHGPKALLVFIVEDA